MRRAGRRRPARGKPPRREFDRLTPGDLMMLWPEDFGWHEDIGALATLSGDDGLTDADGNVRIDAMRDFVSSRLDRVPRFRQQLVVPRRGLGRPLWLDCPDFDIREHLRAQPLSPDPGFDELLATAATLFSEPFEWDRPLWRIWLLAGLRDGRVGMLIKLHHTVADAQAGLGMLGALLDLSPVDLAPAGPVPSWLPQPWPTAAELLGDNVRRRLGAIGAGMRAVGHPVRAWRRARYSVTLLLRMMRRPKAPVTSFNRPVPAAERRFAAVSVEVAAVKQIAHAHGGTLNDVLMCATAGGLRTLLEARGEDHRATLMTNVPVSLHRDEPTGNEVGVIFVPLPLGIEDLDQRLRAIAAAAAVSKRSVFLPPTGSFMDLRPVQRMLWRMMKRQRYSNIDIANVPGPPMPLYFASRRIDDVFPMMSTVGNVPLVVGAISYAGQLNITIVGDAETTPDLAVMADGLRDTLAELGVMPAMPAESGAQPA